MITVLIERHIAPGMASTYNNFARKMLKATVSAPGFISGESLHGIEDPNVRYILIKMQSRENWNNWLASSERRDVVSLLSSILVLPEKITLLSHGT
ncbi:MAG: antibiotic biosynthesis monooxygenase [Porticoccaceae bacterium]|nr:antibiotic biosynthesis monooxygenase [Porticoccaceae bacterium]